ncbi:MAG: hypothetical protein ACR2M5_01185 [Nakamurella sp.]
MPGLVAQQIRETLLDHLWSHRHLGESRGAMAEQRHGLAPQGSTKGFVRVGDCPKVLDACRAACWQLYGLTVAEP